MEVFLLLQNTVVMLGQRSLCATISCNEHSNKTVLKYAENLTKSFGGSSPVGTTVWLWFSEFKPGKQALRR